MKKKILIIDDNAYEYLDVYKILLRYETDILPEPEDAGFIDLVNHFGLSGKTEDLSKIVEQIRIFAPDIIVLDVCLNGADSFNSRGRDIEAALQTTELAKIPVFKVSKQSNAFAGDDNYIHKDSMAAGIKTKVIDRYGIEKRAVPKDIGDIITALENAAKKQGADSGYEILLEQLRKAFNPLEMEERHLNVRFTNRVRIGIDLLIVILFFLSLIILLVAGPLIIWHGAAEHKFDPITIVEHAFLAFLPFLIVFSVFSLYATSLRPYIRGREVTDAHIELGSKLMTVSKELFIASLISYTFAKLIERAEASNANGPYILGGVAVILICYFIYLKSHNKGH